MKTDIEKRLLKRIKADEKPHTELANADRFRQALILEVLRTDDLKDAGQVEADIHTAKSEIKQGLLDDIRQERQQIAQAERDRSLRLNVQIKLRKPKEQESLADWSLRATVHEARLGKKG